ncbi:MAG: RNA methyltransferase [Vallitalea sp.]|jgi:TrmH family RNA methyltransferase|nr:RNA methyltransferase [Vallitalea sp.]
MITSLQNSKIKKIIQITSKSKYRKKEGLFIVEGKKMIDEVDNNKIDEIIISESFAVNEVHYITKLKDKKIHIEIVSDSIMKHISNAVTPQGIMGVIKICTIPLDIVVDENPFIIILENIQDPGNLGTIIRTADAVKASGVIISKGSVDVYNPKVVRSTMGSIFRVPILEGRDIEKDIEMLKDNKIEILACNLKGSINIYDCNLTKGIAVLIGNEGNGLSDNITKLASKNIKIPMIGQAESLNAGVATSIISYEVLRQRYY